MVGKIFHHTITESEKCAQSFIWDTASDFSIKELIISWNGRRPEVGCVFLEISLHVDGEWSPFFPYAEWGRESQRSSSFFSPQYGLKLEEDTLSIQREASHFRLRITNPKTLRSLHVSALGIAEFPSNVHLPETDLSIDLAVPKLSQMTLKHERSRHMCSPTSTTSAIRYLTSDELEVLDFAKNAHDLSADIYGNWVLNVAQASHHLGEKFTCYVARLCSFNEIICNLQKGIPSVVSIRGNLEGAPQPYSTGHLVVIRGIDSKNKKILCMDPAFAEEEKTYVSYPFDEFLNAWVQKGSIGYLFHRNT